MNRKELVQRWRNALGYGQKEMFYYPVKTDKKTCNKLTINTFLYKYYDFESKKFVGKGVECLTQILIKDIKTQKIIYCNKSSKNYSSSVVLNNIPYGKYSLRVISAVYGYVDNTEHIIDVNCEEFNCDIPVKTNIIIIEQYIENKPLDYYLTPNMNGDSNIDSIQITGGAKYKYLDMDNNSLFNTEFVRLPCNTLKTEIWSRHNSIFIDFNFISFPYWEYIDNISFTASYKNGSLKKTQAWYQCGYYTYDDSEKKYVPYHFNIDEIQDSQEIYETINYNIYFHMQQNSIDTYRYNNDDYDTIVESQTGDLGLPPIVNKYAICPWYSKYYDLLDSRMCWLENIYPEYSIKQILNDFCNSYVGRSDFLLDNYDVNTINQEWFMLGYNDIMIYIYNATKGMLSSIEYSNVMNYKQLQNGVQVLGRSLCNADISKESIENFATELEQKTGGTSHIEYCITDMPSLINTDSSLIKHFINDVKIYTKDSNKKNAVLLSFSAFNVKYNNKYFRTSLFPIETKTNKEVFICGLDSQFDFCEDYDSLSAVYL